MSHEDAADAARRLRVARLAKLMTPAEAEQYADLDSDGPETLMLNGFLKDSDGVDFATAICPQPASWGEPTRATRGDDALDALESRARLDLLRARLEYQATVDALEFRHGFQ